MRLLGSETRSKSATTDHARTTRTFILTISEFRKVFPSISPSGNFLRDDERLWNQKSAGNRLWNQSFLPFQLNLLNQEAFYPRITSFLKPDNSIGVVIHRSASQTPQKISQVATAHSGETRKMPLRADSGFPEKKCVFCRVCFYQVFLSGSCFVLGKKNWHTRLRCRKWWKITVTVASNSIFYPLFSVNFYLFSNSRIFILKYKHFF